MIQRLTRVRADRCFDISEAAGKITAMLENLRSHEETIGMLTRGRQQREPGNPS